MCQPQAGAAHQAAWPGPLLGSHLMWDPSCVMSQLCLLVATTPPCLGSGDQDLWLWEGSPAPVGLHFLHSPIISAKTTDSVSHYLILLFPLTCTFVSAEAHQLA